MVHQHQIPNTNPKIDSQERSPKPKGTLPIVTTSLTDMRVPLLITKPSPGEEPGRKEEETMEPHPAIVFWDPKLAQKENIETKRQLSPDLIMCREVDVPNLPLNILRILKPLDRCSISLIPSIACQCP